MATRVRPRAADRRRAVHVAERRPFPSSRTSVVVLAASAALLGWLMVPPRMRQGNYGELKQPHLSSAEARAFNARVPFLSGSYPAARPFRFRGTQAAKLQAAECLATASLYEVGQDERGQRAVMQVVLNRVRARGFPKTVCGVVYQGAELPTGCQFSFTCDGSLVRRPEHAGWVEARRRAMRALSGTVFRPIGEATHYHADWVVPHWISSLDKLARVRSHIFYRQRHLRVLSAHSSGAWR